VAVEMRWPVVPVAINLRVESLERWRWQKETISFFFFVVGD